MYAGRREVIVGVRFRGNESNQMENIKDVHDLIPNGFKNIIIIYQIPFVR